MTADVWVDEEDMSSKLDGIPWTRPHLVAINGMGSQGNDVGFASDVANQVDHEVWATTIIDYTAAAFPMGPSVLEGIEKVVAWMLALAIGTKKVLVGYSEGSLVIDTVWRDECINPNGRLHQHYLNGDIICVVVIGDPMRCPGIANGNVLAGFPVPKNVDGVVTGGISGTNDLKPEETPACVLSCTNDGDVYGAAPVGDNPWTAITGVGFDMQLIFNLVQSFTAANFFAVVTEVLKVLGIDVGALSLYSVLTIAEQAMQGFLEGLVDGVTNVPVTGVTTVSHVAYLVQAIMTFGMFVLKGLGPHGDYEKMVPAIVAHLNDLGRQYATI